MFFYGLRVEELHNTYIGWRAIYQNDYVDIVPNRRSEIGEEADLKLLLDWVNKPVNTEPRKRKISPWKRMLKEVPQKLYRSERGRYEIREGDFVLRADTLASYGYLYIALFKIEYEQSFKIEHEQSDN
jgi:hypothetical protein